MLWLILSLLTALSVAIRDVSIKSFDKLNPQEIATLELFWSLIPLGIGYLSVPVPELDPIFWWIFIVSLPLNVLAYFLYLYAIKSSPITLCVPFLAFTPVFMILTGFFVLNENINLWGGLGIGLIVLGSYVLNLDKAAKGIFKPLTTLFHEKGSWLMLIVAFLFSFAAVLGKKAIIHSSPLFFSYFFFLVFNLTVLAFLFLSGKSNWRQLQNNRKKGIWLGGLLAIHVSCHGLAIAISTAVYMIALKRSSILFSVLLSWIILKEDQITTRGLGTLFMFTGVLLIVFWG